MSEQGQLEIFRPELHAFVYRAVLEVGDQTVGAKVVDELLAQHGASRTQVLDPEAWVSLAFTEAFLDDLFARAQDPLIYTRVGRLVVSPSYLGPRHAFMRAFASPMSCYTLIARTVGTMNKTGTYRVERTGRSSCVLEFMPVPGIGPERTPHMCTLRRVTIAGITTVFDLPAAQIDHPTCIARGDATCTYKVSWIEPIGRLAPWIGAAIGIGAGLLVFMAGGQLSWMRLLGFAFATLGGWAIGRGYRSQRELSARTHDLTAQQDALETSLRANEQRFAELLQAKMEVDDRVEQRTTELRETTQRLSETLQEVQALDKAKTDFFNNVSHELRSPLTLILAPLEDLAAGRSPAQGERQAFESMRRNAARLLHLINQLLDLAKIDAGQMEIYPVPTDLVSMLRSILTAFESAARQKGAHLELRAPSDLSPVVLDPSWIESAVTNLVANALRFTSPGGAVRVLVDDRGGDVVVTVADDGPGIEPKDRERVFARFAQGDSNKRIGGTGIGLALVREAARLHGGDVRLTSELGKGSSFTVTLPRRPEQPAGVGSPKPPRTHAAYDLASEPIEENGARAERPGPARGAPLALVVEDNPELREFMADVLAVNYRVRTAVDGAEGLVIATELKPDVVVSDVAMPDMNGYQLCRALHEQHETRGIPVLLVTARTEIASVLEGFEAGASDYVLKPFHGRELLARVDVHVRLRRMLQEFAQRERHAALGVLAASVAHQVRNPLTTLISGLPAMKQRVRTKVDERTNDLMDVMVDCAVRIERVTLDLMDLSRVDREEGGNYRPSDGLRSAVRLLRARAPNAMTMEEHIEDSAIIHGRAGDMNHVFLNLIDNAVRAAGEQGHVRVDAWMAGDAYMVRVGDSGPGVNADVAERIFEPFFTTRQAGEGTGLGLAIARQVVHQAAGQISLERSELGGAAFLVRIPVTKRLASSPVRAQAN